MEGRPARGLSREIEIDRIAPRPEQVNAGTDTHDGARMPTTAGLYKVTTDSHADEPAAEAMSTGTAESSPTDANAVNRKTGRSTRLVRLDSALVDELDAEKRSIQSLYERGIIDQPAGLDPDVGITYTVVVRRLLNSTRNHRARRRRQAERGRSA